MGINFDDAGGVRCFSVWHFLMLSDLYVDGPSISVYEAPLKELLKLELMSVGILLQ